VPHLTDAIQDWIDRVSRIPVDDTNEEPDIYIIELGGTAGDIESAPFIEAMRQFKRESRKGKFFADSCLIDTCYSRGAEDEADAASCQGCWKSWIGS